MVFFFILLLLPTSLFYCIMRLMMTDADFVCLMVVRRIHLLRYASNQPNFIEFKSINLNAKSILCIINSNLSCLLAINESITQTIVIRNGV